MWINIILIGKNSENRILLNALYAPMRFKGLKITCSKKISIFISFHLNWCSFPSYIKRTKKNHLEIWQTFSKLIDSVLKQFWHQPKTIQNANVIHINKRFTVFHIFFFLSSTSFPPFIFFFYFRLFCSLFNSFPSFFHLRFSFARAFLYNKI